MEGLKVYRYVVRQWSKLIDGFNENLDLNPDKISFGDLTGIAAHLFNFRGFEEVNGAYPGFLEKCGLTDPQEVAEFFYNSSNASQGRRAKQLLQIAPPGSYILMDGYGAGPQDCANVYRQPLTLAA